MEENKSFNKRKKSIMIIDKKGRTKELIKNEDSASTLIDPTEKVNKESGIMLPKDQEKSALSEHSVTEVSKINEISKVKEGEEGVINVHTEGKSPETANLHEMSNKENVGEKNKEENVVEKNEEENENEKNEEENENKEEKSEENENKEENIDEKNNEENKNEPNTSKNISSPAEKKTLSMRNAEIAAGTSVGAAAIMLGKGTEEKNVVIDEDQNEEHTVSADANRDISLTQDEKNNIKTRSPSFTPQKIPTHALDQDSEILKEREDDNVEAEGHMWKRRKIFACFWHEKYFLLTKEGILKYHKANGTKKSKGNWDLKKINRVHEVFMGGQNHPFRLALMGDEENFLFGFDDSDSREYWFIKLSKYTNQDN